MHIHAQIQMNAENMFFLKYKMLKTCYYKLFKNQIDKDSETYFGKENIIAGCTFIFQMQVI